MQKFPEDELAKRRRAMMSTETVLDYKKRIDDAKAEVEAKGRFEEAEKWARIAEELKKGVNVKEMWPDHVFSCRAAERSCPVCESLKREANFQKIPKTLIGVDLATKPSQMVGFDYSGTELKIAAQMDEAMKKEEDRTFMDLLERYLPVGAGPWPPPQPDPMYKIEGTRRNMHDDFVRRMQRELRSDMPFMRVTSTDPTKSKADVWAAVKKFLDSRRDKTAVPVLSSDIKIEPLTPDVLRDGFRHLDRGRPRDCWEKAREALNRLPGDTPLFYNEVLGEYGGSHIRGNSVDAVYIDEAAKMEPNANGDIVDTAKAVATFKHWEETICAGLGVPRHPSSRSELRESAQKLYAEGKISRETMLKYTEVKDESGSGEAVREPEGKGRDEEV